MIELSPSVVQLFVDLNEHNIELQATGDEVRFRPRSAMTPKLLAELRSHKGEILHFLDTAHVITEMRAWVVSLWRDGAWLRAWEHRLQGVEYANLDALPRVLDLFIDMAEEHHRRREWQQFTDTRKQLERIASGELWDKLDALSHDNIVNGSIS